MKVKDVRLKMTMAPINKLLESRYGLTIESDDADHISAVQAHYAAKRTTLLRALGESATSHPDYAKSVLIAEAAGILLREIAPKRMKRKSKPKA